jgi:hypothetical protein
MWPRLAGFCQRLDRERDSRIQRSASVFFLLALLPPSHISRLLLGVCGRLWNERTIGASIEGRTCFWRHVETPDSPPPQPTVGLAVVPLNHDWTPVEDWREAISQLLDSPHVKIRIAENTWP